MNWYEHLHPVVATSLPQVTSTDNLTADDPVAHYLVGPAQRARHCRIRRLLPPPSRSHHILRFTYRFSLRADTCAVAGAEFTATLKATILINRYIPLWGCPPSMLLDNGLQVCSKLSHAVYNLVGVQKITASSYHPNGNRGVERVNHTTAEMLAIGVNELQHNWDASPSFLDKNNVLLLTGS